MEKNKFTRKSKISTENPGLSICMLNVKLHGRHNHLLKELHELITATISFYYDEAECI